MRYKTTCVFLRIKLQNSNTKVKVSNLREIVSDCKPVVDVKCFVIKVYVPESTTVSFVVKKRRDKG